LLVLQNLETPKKFKRVTTPFVSFVVCAKILPLGGQKQKFGVAHTKVFSGKKKKKSAKVAKFLRE
jgi:hypothetical protein